MRRSLDTAWRHLKLNLERSSTNGENTVDVERSIEERGCQMYLEGDKRSVTSRTLQQ